MTISPPVALHADPPGSQQPRILCVPDYTSSSGREAIEVAELAGLELDPWQQLVLLHSLGEKPGGRWAAFVVGLVVPRQNGKGTCLEARELAGAFAFGEKLIIHSAHEQATSSEHFRRLLNLIEGVPDFDSRVLKVVRGKGSEAIELRGGYRIFFKTRTGGGGRGLTGDLVVLDEAMILPVATTAALVPTMAARSITGNPQLWYAGSAVDQQKHEHGIVLARLRERALRGDLGVCYLEWSAVGDDPARVPDSVRGDREVWAGANPGLGIRISLEHIANENAGALGPREFAGERLGIGDWPDTSENSGRIISVEAWAACSCVDESKRITSAKTFAVDVNPDRTWGSIGVAGRRDDGLAHVALVDRARGTDWIVGRCSELKMTNRRVGFVVDVRGPAANLIADMRAAGLKVIEADSADYAKACSDWFDGVANRTLRYPAPQPELDEALADARTAPLGDAWKWSRKNSTSADITPLVACTLAHWGAMTQKSGRAQFVSLADALAAAEARDAAPAPA